MLKLIIILISMLAVLIVFEIVHRAYSQKQIKKQLDDLNNQNEGLDIMAYRNSIK